MSEPADGRTVLRRHAQYRDRWSGFDERAGLAELSDRPTPAELAGFEVFAGCDEKLLEKLSPDVSVARWQAGSVLFEQGSFIDLAFYVAAGEIELYLDRAAGDAADDRRPLFEVERTFLMPTPGGSGDLAADSTAGGSTAGGGSRKLSRTLLARDLAARGGITFLATMDVDLPEGGRVRLGPGELVGEIGAMSGWPQPVTARTTTPATLVQIRLPALRTLRRRVPEFKQRLDTLYRRLSLADQLRAAPLFAGCGERFLEAIQEEVELVSLEPGEVVVREGESAEALYLVRAGFLKLRQRFAAGEMVVNYLSKGMTLGEAELLLGDTGGWTVTAESVEHAELVRLPAARLAALLAAEPDVERRLWEAAAARTREAGFTRRHAGRGELLETALEMGLVQANALLAIDLDRCTRCDDCVRACAATHQGRPRFVREGDKVGTLQIAHACYHCRDPVCLVGCPTGAIHRTGVGAVVAVDENLCIGCGTCARACPYDAILMHQTGEVWPDDMVPESLRGRDRLVASKCDLCYTRAGGPACVESCPNGCAHRVGRLEDLEELLRR